MSHDSNLNDSNPNVEGWRDAWRDLGCTASDSGFHDLVTRYAEAHRRYHTTQHLSECLGLWRRVRGLASRPGEVAIALWFHDAVYDTRRQDNEERSADLARDAVTRAGVPSAVGARVHALIMATRHDAVPSARRRRHAAAGGYRPVDSGRRCRPLQ
jgi:predicted metal-dependent HD superfamily phosphohydrolase